MSARIKPGYAGRHHEHVGVARVWPRSRVFSWVTVSVAFSRIISSETGRPTTFERPTMQARTPASGQRELRSSSSITAAGRRGHELGPAAERKPALG